MSRLNDVLCCGLLALGIAGCGPVDGADAVLSAQESALVSNTKVFIVPVDARVRTLCREQTNQFYCDSASAEDAAVECLEKIALRGGNDVCKDGGEGCLRYEVVTEPCSGPQEIYPTVESCTSPVLNSCTYYSSCVEPNVSCGEDGYALGYGEKYCTAFKNASFSPRGDAWIESVMLCLQEALIPYSQPEGQDASCDEIKEVAFDSHPPCYTAPENSICFLPPGDVITILRTIGGQELLAARTLRQIKSVIGTCIGDIGRLLVFGQRSSDPSSGSRSLMPSELDGVAERALAEQLEFWQELDRQYR